MPIPWMDVLAVSIKFPAGETLVPHYNPGTYPEYDFICTYNAIGATMSNVVDRTILVISKPALPNLGR